MQELLANPGTKPNLDKLTCLLNSLKFVESGPAHSSTESVYDSFRSLPRVLFESLFAGNMRFLIWRNRKEKDRKHK